MSDEELRPFADDPGADPELRELFGAARRDLPPVDAPRLARAAAPPAWPKLVAGTGAAVVLLALGAWLARPSSPVAPLPPPVVEAPPSPPPAPEVAVIEAPAAVATEVTEAPIARREVRPRRPEVEPPAPVVEADPIREGTILLRARRALAADDAGGALEATEEHASAFPRGELSPEREAIAIDALLALGRSDEARARAERFASRWPSSVYAARVRRALEAR